MAGPKPNVELEVLHVGATIADLATIFDTSQRDIKQRIVGKVEPASLPHKTPVRYKIASVAPLLCKVEVNIEEALRTMPPSKLPPQLQEAFWKGQRSRLEYQKEVGRLWSTDRVVQMLGDAFKPFVLAVRTFTDSLSQSTELSPEAKILVTQAADRLLKDLSFRLTEQYKDYPVHEDEHGPPLAGAELPVISDEDDDGLGE